MVIKLGIMNASTLFAHDLLRFLNTFFIKTNELYWSIM
jgi:hypothetical protein